MMATRSLGRQFGLLWAAYAVSTFGSWLAFDALPLIAILVLHAGPTEVSVLAAAGLAVGALVAVPLGPWVEFRRKRPVMVAMDLTRFAAVMSIPAAFALGWLTFVQLLVVSIVVAAANVAFSAASGACLKAIVRPEDLLVANARFESTTWTATLLGPPLGGVAIGVFGPVTTVVADAISYLASAAGIRAIGVREPVPMRTDTARLRAADLLAGWRYILTHPALRPLLFNTILVNGLILATAPLVAVLMLGRLGFAPWQYGLAFGAPCVGGLIGSRSAYRLVARFGRHKVMLGAGALRACWSLGLAFIRPGASGILLVIVLQLGLVTCAGVFNPVFATYRLDHAATDRVARILSAWSVTSKATIAAMTALFGLLASITGPRVAIAIAGVLMLGTPLLLPRRDHPLRRERAPARGQCLGRALGRGQDRLAPAARCALPARLAGARCSDPLAAAAEQRERSRLAVDAAMVEARRARCAARCHLRAAEVRGGVRPTIAPVAAAAAGSDEYRARHAGAQPELALGPLPSHRPDDSGRNGARQPAAAGPRHRCFVARSAEDENTMDDPCECR